MLRQPAIRYLSSSVVESRVFGVFCLPQQMWCTFSLQLAGHISHNGLCDSEAVWTENGGNVRRKRAGGANFTSRQWAVEGEYQAQFSQWRQTQPTLTPVTLLSHSFGKKKKKTNSQLVLLSSVSAKAAFKRGFLYTAPQQLGWGYGQLSAVSQAPLSSHSTY